MDNYNFYRNNNKPQNSRGLFSYFVVGIIGAVIGAMLVLIFAPAVLLEKVVPKEEQEPAQVQQSPVISQRVEVPQITEIAKERIPTVVGIRTTKYKEEMFSGKTKIEGVSSGVIVDSKGYILTNCHVADSQALDIMVFLADGRSVNGQTVWADPDIDLSIIKIEADNLKVAEIGNSDNLQVGELAIAIGNPLGMRSGRSVTAGIISALGRTIPMDEEKFMEDLIQTDASINSDNSGGPLFDGDGKVIGINTIKVTSAAKAAGAASAAGMGFAIPINIAQPVIKSLVESGKFTAPYLGLTGLDKEIANFYNYNISKGIYIINIDKNGPMYNSGIKKGDIILEINNTPINTLTSLKQSIFSAGVGGEVKIIYQDSSGILKTVITILQ